MVNWTPHDGPGMSTGDPAPTVLDVAQLRRIQGTHRGFLYQYLYAVLCYLAAPKTRVRCIRVERDEDVEITVDGRTVYAQLKHYSDPLSPSALSGVSERFDAIRAAHASGDRGGDAVFAIVAPAGLGPTLAEKDWPDDVLIVTSETDPAELDRTGLLVPPPTLEALFLRAQELADTYRLSALKPASLVSKLVGAVSRAAAGQGETSLSTNAIDDFCELVAAQLHTLPTVSEYVPQDGEPRLPDEARRGLVVVGHSGYGKSAWAANVAALSSRTVAYVPCSTSAGGDVAARVVQAAVATLAARGDVRAHDVVLPGRDGIDALSLLDRALEHRSIALTVILDDCHRSSADALTEAIRATRTIRWCLVGRPSVVISEVATLTDLESHVLGGWDADTIAKRLSEVGASAAPEAVAELRQLTGGAPLFVLRAIAEIAEGGGDTSAYCSKLAAGEGSRQSAQERILERTISSLERDGRRVAAVLAQVDLDLSVEEWSALVAEPLNIPSRAARRSLRNLVERHIATETERSQVAAHDAFRPLLRGRDLSSAELEAVLRRAVQLLRLRLSDERALDALVPLLRILAALGDMSQLADVANAMSDWIRETGSRSEVKSYVELAVLSDVLSDADRFWALDTLAFLDLEGPNVRLAEKRLAEMEHLAEEVGPETQGALLHKRLLVAAQRGKLKAVRSIVAIAPTQPRYEKILRYHGALAEADAGEVDTALDQLRGLVDDYMSALHLTPRQVLGANPPALIAHLEGASATPLPPSQSVPSTPRSVGAVMGDVRRLADCCDAITKIGRKYAHTRALVGLYAIWATKFYGIVGAHRSALVAAQEMLDVILEDLGDPEEARRWMESVVLPTAQHASLPDLSIPIRAQYGVILAHCGDFDAATAIFDALAPYIDSLPPEGQVEIANQKVVLAELIARGPATEQEIATRRARLAAQNDLANQMSQLLAKRTLPETGVAARSKKIGRNQPCPCGSGKKYKKCCGGPPR